MTQASAHIDAAYKHLSRVLVSGDGVDLLALARQELRMAYKLALEAEKEVGDDG